MDCNPVIYDDEHDVSGLLEEDLAMEEVRHKGYWVQGDYYDIGDVCSECDYDSCEDDCHLPVCPQCGAEMYLGED